MSGAATPRRIRQDKATAGIKLGATPVEVRPDGYRIYEGIARWGNVLAPYPDLDPPRVEFCPIEEVASPRALASAMNIPLTGGPRIRDWDGNVTLPADHAPELLTPDTAGDATEGSIILATRDDTTSPPSMRVRVITYTRAIQDLIESGVVELSLGYRCTEDPTPGFFDGKRYDLIQRDHEYNHLNLVRSARSRAPDGRPARLDSDDGLDALAERSILDAAVVRGIRHGRLNPGPPILPLPLPRPFTTDDAAVSASLSNITLRGAEKLLAARANQRGKSSSYPPPASVATMKKKPTTKTPAADPNARNDAADLSALGEADAALLAQMSPEAQAALGVMTGGEEVAAEEAAADVAEDAAEDAAEVNPDAPAPGPLDEVLATLAKFEERLAALEGKKADAGTVPPPAAAANAEKTDAPTLAAEDKKTMTDKKDALLTNPAAIIAAASASAEKAFNTAAEFVGVVRKDGHAANTTGEAATVMLTVIKAHLPVLVLMAEDAIKTNHTDSLVALYGQAESIRRDSLVSAQADILGAALHAPAESDGVFHAPAGFGKSRN